MKVTHSLTNPILFEKIICPITMPYQPRAKFNTFITQLYYYQRERFGENHIFLVT